MERTHKGDETRKKILDFIKAYHAATPYRSPSLQEIADGVEGVNSKSVVNYHLMVMQLDGVIRRDFNAVRAIEVIERPLPGNEENA